MELDSLHADISRVKTALLHAHIVMFFAADPIIKVNIQVNKEKGTARSQLGTLWSAGIFPGRSFTPETRALVKDPNAFHSRLPHEHVNVRHGFAIVPHLSFTVS